MSIPNRTVVTLCDTLKHSVTSILPSYLTKCDHKYTLCICKPPYM